MANIRRVTNSQSPPYSDQLESADNDKIIEHMGYHALRVRANLLKLAANLTDTAVFIERGEYSPDNPDGEVAGRIQIAINIVNVLNSFNKDEIEKAWDELKASKIVDE